MVDYKFIIILSFMKELGIFWIRYGYGYDEIFPYFIDVLP